MMNDELLKFKLKCESSATHLHARKCVRSWLCVRSIIQVNVFQSPNVDPLICQCYWHYFTVIVPLEETWETWECSCC